MKKNSFAALTEEYRRDTRKRERPPPPQETLHDYSLKIKGHEDVVYLRKVEDQVKTLPPMRDILAYIASLPERPLWYRASQEAIINSQTLCFPDIPVLTRSYILDFLRTPHGSGERTCGNSICESERLGGFRLRVLELPGEPLGDWCYLCHLFYTNRLYFESLNRQDDKSSVYQIHSFMVAVDVPGEYRLDMTLTGEKDVKGVFGPFPLYNCNNYAPTVYPNGCKGWAESNVMVFRLSQVASSNPTESSAAPNKMGASDRTGFQKPSFACQ